MHNYKLLLLLLFLLLFVAIAVVFNFFFFCQMPSDFELEFVGFPPSKTSWFVYDAVWALTQGLNALTDTVSYATFDPFDVGNQDNRQR